MRGPALRSASKAIRVPSTVLPNAQASARKRVFQATPHWLPPDRVAHALRRIVPMWAPAAVLAVVGLLGYFGLNAWLGRDTDRQLAAHQDIVQLPPQTARITITLP